MIIRLFEETLLDINKYLRSDELVQSLNTRNPKLCCQDVVNRCKTRFEGLVMPHVCRVQVCKIISDKTYDVIDPDYYVVKFNNTFYDYCAREFFGDVFVVRRIPVTQIALNIPELINSTLSSVKDYVLIQIPEEVPDTEDDVDLDIEEESIEI